MVILIPSPAVPSALLFTILLFFFFFSSNTLVSAAGNHCTPSSCGNITNIRYPFRLKDDPSNCGDSNFELTCDHLNHTVLTLFSNSYYITNITYYRDDHEDYFYDYVEIEIQMKYVGMEKYNNNGSCSHLPLLASPLTFSNLNRGNKYYWTYYWVTLVNCSKEVKKNKSIDEYYYDYNPVPCLSHSNNSSFIYLTQSYDVGSLMPSCRYLAMFPSNKDWYQSGQQPIDIFKFLAQGFTLFRTQSRLTPFRDCLKRSFRENYQDITDHNNSITQRIQVIVFGIE